MGNYKKEINQPFLEKIAKAIRDRLKELRMTKYAFCRDNNFNRATCDRILKARYSFSLSTLAEYLEAAGLEIKIVKKDERDN